MKHKYDAEDISKRRVDELQHHGIKGMKWGIRRFQKKDGSLTPEGKRRYLDKPTRKEKRQQEYEKLCSAYKREGMSDEQAEKTAKGYIAAKKALIGIGAVAVTAAVAYGAYKYYDNNVDRVISPKQVMQTVHDGSISERLKPGNPFYASYTKADNFIYASKAFPLFDHNSNISTFYTDDGVKVASRGTGRKVFKELLNTNPELKEFVRKSEWLYKYENKPKELYDRFNKHLVVRGEENDRIHKIFYDALKAKGYGALVDVNDSVREGFAYKPVMVFDDQIKHITSSTVATPKHLGTSRTAKASMLTYARRILNKPLDNPLIMGATAVGAASSVALAVNSAPFVRSYKKQHPNTKLTDFQIVSMYIQGQQSKSKKK